MADLQKKLFLAIEKADIRRVKRLVRMGADVNGLNASGETPLAVACCSPQNSEIKKVVAYLINEGADINKFESGGYTPLFRAVLANRPFVVQMLLENGDNPNIKYFPQNTPKDISSAFDLAYMRFLEAVIKQKKGYYDDFNILQSQIFCNQSLMLLLSEAGARHHEKEVVPEYS
jgi:ankyrin repeat protein